MQTKFTWKGFENREFCVDFKNEADEMEFLKECEKRGWLWNSGRKPTENTKTKGIGVNSTKERLINLHDEIKVIIYNPHPIDCSIAENYIMERNKIRNENCGISNEIYAEELNGNSKLAIEIVQNWSDEHPVEKVTTYLDKLMETFPNVKITCDGTPTMCPSELGLKTSCTSLCAECWRQPYKENNNE